MASSSIVIKVKFGETLRRFTAAIHDQKLALDVVTLREKIRTLFGFDSDVDFTLTYVDEDGDEVTLADDDDIHDVVRQSLNPLRITVKLNKGKPDEPNKTSPPLRSVNSGVAEILKSVPEPFRDVLAKLPLDLASKASSSAPGIAELVEKLTKTYLNQLSDPTASPNGAANANGQKGKKAESSNANGGKGKSSESSVVKESKAPVDPEVGKSKSKKKEQVQKVKSAKSGEFQPPRDVDLNVPCFENEPFQTIFGMGDLFNGRTYSQVLSDLPSMKNKDTTTNGSSSEKKNTGFPAPCLDHLKPYFQDRNVTDIRGFSSADFSKATNGSGSSSGWAQGTLNAANECPFSGTPFEDELGWNAFQPSRNPWRRGSNHGSGLGNIFHRGVRCDGCGVHPIVGPRYKSKVKDDYDLCSVCFAGMGNVADYTRLDRPTHPFRHHHHMPLKGLHEFSLRIPPPTLPHAMRAPGAKLPRSKLDSRFILDVNVLDGTIMAPLTAFTKIWRMRNNGTITWPRGSQLQWIGGDWLSNSASVEIEIPADGLPVDKEIDVAVDFTAPELPGRYISYWKMASPSGQKFGQRVWVLIQVDASMKDLGETSINLNLPPVMRNPEVVDETPVMDSNGVLPENNNFIGVTESEGWQPKDQEMNFPINDTLIIDNNNKNGELTTNTLPVGPVTASPLYPTLDADIGFPTSGSALVGAAVSSGFYPTLGGEDTGSSVDQIVYTGTKFSEAGPSAPAPAVAVVQPSGAASEEVVRDEREAALLMELEDMGFKQADLNKKILRTNNYNLEKSVDELCGVSEWDPMLEELQEMGFADNEANRRLLKKNNGSIKGVVMDLINGEGA